MPMGSLTEYKKISGGVRVEPVFVGERRET
jgi:hypothetical protein